MQVDFTDQANRKGTARARDFETGYSYEVRSERIFNDMDRDRYLVTISDGNSIRRASFDFSANDPEKEEIDRILSQVSSGNLSREQSADIGKSIRGLVDKAFDEMKKEERPFVWIIAKVKDEKNGIMFKNDKMLVFDDNADKQYELGNAKDLAMQVLSCENNALPEYIHNLVELGKGKFVTERIDKNLVEKWENQLGKDKAEAAAKTMLTDLYFDFNEECIENKKPLGKGFLKWLKEKEPEVDIESAAKFKKWMEDFSGHDWEGVEIFTRVMLPALHDEYENDKDPTSRDFFHWMENYYMQYAEYGYDEYARDYQGTQERLFDNTISRISDPILWAEKHVDEFTRYNRTDGPDLLIARIPEGVSFAAEYPKNLKNSGISMDFSVNDLLGKAGDYLFIGIEGNDLIDGYKGVMTERGFKDNLMQGRMVKAPEGKVQEEGKDHAVIIDTDNKIRIEKIDFTNDTTIMKSWGGVFSEVNDVSDVMKGVEIRAISDANGETKEFQRNPTASKILGKKIVGPVVLCRPKPFSYEDEGDDTDKFIGFSRKTAMNLKKILEEKFKAKSMADDR